jgi:hypothetical protein
MMRGIEQMATQARETRTPVSGDNPFLSFEKTMSSWMSSSLAAWGRMRDSLSEAAFFWTYESPVVRAAVGISPDAAPRQRKMERDLARQARLTQQRLELESRFEAGGPAEAVLRALIYIHAPEGGIDERAFTMLREFRAAKPAGETRSMPELKAMLREQTLLLRLDEERAIEAIPKLLPHAIEKRRSALNGLRRILDTRAALAPQATARFKRIETLFHAKSDHAGKEDAPGGAGRKRGGDHVSAVH